MEPAVRTSEPAGGAPEPTGKAWTQLGGRQSQPRGPGEVGGEEEKKRKIMERSRLCGGTIGHQPRRGRCPKTRSYLPKKHIVTVNGEEEEEEEEEVGAGDDGGFG